MTDATAPAAEQGQRIGVGPDSTLGLHPLVVRDSDDDPDAVVMGRTELGEFVELPRVAADAIELLGQGRTIGEAEAAVAAEHDVRLDLGELAEALVELGFVATVDSQPIPDLAQRLPGSHLPWLHERHVRWLFSQPVGALWLGVLIAAIVTWWQQPDLFVEASDFYWTSYVGLAVLVNTVLFSVSLSVHELMHLAAARSYGAPARISFATRLHHLVVQTDVTAIWAVPRRLRYRVYLAGILWDGFVICACTLLVAYAGLPAGVDRLLTAVTLCVLLSLLFQLQVYMRIDLYYVLMEWLRCRNLFHDGMAYAGHLLRRLAHRPSADPSAGLPARERRAVRLYAVAMAVGSVVALSGFALLGLPILVEGVVRAFTGLIDGVHTGGLLQAIDSALIIVVEGTLQVIFLVTFYRRHRHRLDRRTWRAGGSGGQLIG